MSKKLCKLVKEDVLKEDISLYIEKVKKAKYVCKKCGRVAEKEEDLCKTKKLK